MIKPVLSLIINATWSRAMQRLLSLALMVFFTAMVFSASCGNNCCCEDKGGIQYCDSSAGRYVCSDGDYSSCYCTRNAVMDLQRIRGCCLWQGGVMKIEEDTGLVICNNGGTSEMCRIQYTFGTVSLW